MTEQLTANRAPEKRWYVIHTYSGYENKVKANLEHRIESMGMEDKIFQVLVPMEDEIEIRQGRRHTVQKKVYPGYVLVEMILDPNPGRRRNTPGVTSFRRQRQHPRHAQRADPARRDRGQADPPPHGRRDAQVPRRVHQGPERCVTRWPVRRVHRHRRRGQPRAQQVEGPREHLRPGRRRAELFDLQEVELDRRLAAEDAHQDLDLVALGVDLVDRADELGERPVGDADALALGEGDAVLGRLDAHVAQDLLDLGLVERDRLAADARGCCRRRRSS